LFFQNHEYLKISDPSSVLSAVLIYGGLALLAFWFARRGDEGVFLDRSASEQLRGVAILFVMVGHIGAHVLARNESWPVLGKFGVSVFFLLSGFGLARSWKKRELLLKEFVFRRLSRVMIPYCTVTILILSADYFLLNRRYSLYTMLLTLGGINLSIAAKHIDYVRWYITVLLIWYTVFAIYMKRSSGRQSIVWLFVVGVILVVVNYYITSLGYAFLSFPCGVLIGFYYERLCSYLKRYTRGTLLMISIAGLTASYLTCEYMFAKIGNSVPFISVVFGREILLVGVGFWLMVTAYSAGRYRSSFLMFIGRYSYEVFLLHGIFMIKYDFWLFRSELFLSFWPCFVLIMLSAMFMRNVIFNRVQEYIGRNVRSM
jgi:peptidoglycan/LPS O-acetylase OafA/YrhL